LQDEILESFALPKTQKYTTPSEATFGFRIEKTTEGSKYIVRVVLNFFLPRHKIPKVDGSPAVPSGALMVKLFLVPAPSGRGTPASRRAASWRGVALKGETK